MARLKQAGAVITGMPTFGRVPKSGCVPLGYSLDHIGPTARTAPEVRFLDPALRFRANAVKPGVDWAS